MEKGTLLLGTRAILEQMGFRIVLWKLENGGYWPDNEGFMHLTPSEAFDGDCLMAWSDDHKIELGHLGDTLVAKVDGVEYPLNAGAEISELQKLAVAWLN